MELKYVYQISSFFELKSSNCTFMELKLTTGVGVMAIASGSNCTFMELKWQYTESQSKLMHVLIVPLWN